MSAGAGQAEAPSITGAPWATVPPFEGSVAAIRDLERLDVPWHWERHSSPAADGTTAVYGIPYADVGLMDGAAPHGHVPVHTRADAQYAFRLYVAVQRRAEPVQLSLTDLLGDLS